MFWDLANMFAFLVILACVLGYACTRTLTLTHTYTKTNNFFQHTLRRFFFIGFAYLPLFLLALLLMCVSVCAVEAG